MSREDPGSFDSAPSETETLMRGPGLRTSTDLRRLWRCPVCGSERKAHKTETSLRCSCNESRPQMKLIEGLRKTRPEPRPVARFFEEADLPPDETPVPKPVPARQPPIVESQNVTPSTSTAELPAATENSADAVPTDSPARKKRRRRSRGGRGEQDEKAEASLPAGTTGKPEVDASSNAEFGDGIADATDERGASSAGEEA